MIESASLLKKTSCKHTKSGDMATIAEIILGILFLLFIDQGGRQQFQEKINIYEFNKLLRWKKVYLSSQDMEKVLRELDKDEKKAKVSSQEILQQLKTEIADIAAKLDKLFSAYLDEIVSAEEYAAQKHKLLARKVEHNEEISEIENGNVSWLEPAREFVKSLNHATELVWSGDKSEMTTFLKQIGSNHILIDKSFSFSPKKPFQILAERHVSRREVELSRLQNSNWRRGWDFLKNSRFISRHSLD